MKIDKKELEKWIKDCGVSGCNHKEPINDYYADLECERCKTDAHVITCGHENGTKYACLACGQKWEFLK